MPKLPEYDPLNVPASREQINTWRRTQEEAPLFVGGFQLDVDQDSLHRLQLRIHNWEQIGTANVAWMTADNHQVWLTKDDLGKLYAHAMTEKARRSSVLHDTAQQFKRDGVTLRQLREWTL
ncbi:DUF4376 domain-containing protein [Microbulbifer sp. 2304DJ12-6]|uniref:DUF4376 domain-containing protein n=1 Tax=Microbulbifer sp. 2304DJ12-6 TaxID=3233340 RepID=UPI0039AFD078